MKEILIKISLIIFGILLVSTIILDGYAALIFLKLGEATDIFDKLRVVSKYHLFERLYLGSYLMVTNMVLLGTGVFVLVKTFLKK